MLSEQGFLRTSIVATVLVAILGIAFGLLSGSFSIAFDGAYSLIDAGMTMLALWVTRLIVRSGQGDGLSGALGSRFTMGFWHLEPIVLGLNGTLLIAVAIYALINAAISVLNGGHELRFDLAIVYALFTLGVCMIMAVIGARANRSLKSDFIALDVKSWIMSGCITSALLIAFIIGHTVAGTHLESISRYVDPVVLALVCLIIIPIPVGTVRRALSDILLIAPADLKAHVDRVAGETVRKHGFLAHRAYVAKIGRAMRVELYFVVPRDFPPTAIVEWDRIRDDVGKAVGGESHNRWLVIAFTADARWAE
jgi:predicted Co/Zn/Cd cation transporter (cation efflux family)